MKLKLKHIFFIFIGLIVLWSCSKKAVDIIKIDEPTYKIKENEIVYYDKWLSTIPKSDSILAKKNNDTLFVLNYNKTFDVKIAIKYPNENKIIGTILMLHGRGKNFEEWCNYSTFCEKALANGYILIIPNLGKTNYILSDYNETEKHLRIYPTLTWLINVMVTTLQTDFSLLKPEQNNFVAGISTGARGATFFALYLPKIFNAVASLSGDYDLTDTQNMSFYSLYLGDYYRFKNRWKQECFASYIKKYKTPTYFAHSVNDNVVSYKQSYNCVSALEQAHPKIQFDFHLSPVGGHDYIFWESETNNILKFFNSQVAY